MNYLARNVYVGKDEWEKYIKVNDKKQLASYRIMEQEKRWPKIIDSPVETRPWKPTEFLKDGETRSFGDWKLEVVSVPGHTKDSLCFYEKSLAYLFCGDVIYTGALYLHLPDSSLGCYHATLLRLRKLMEDRKDKEVLLWPAHNRIPVHKGYLTEAIHLVEDIEKGTTIPTGSAKADTIFTDSVEFQRDKVKIIIQKGEWDAIRKKKSE
jgi:glyoxylase-like metal-dependent hydrolase (beta-lactamase superfamily II)